MQVIFLPNGSGPTRNFRLRLGLIGFAAALVLSGTGAGAAYLGYNIARVTASGPGPAADAGEAIAASAPLTAYRAMQAPQVVRQRVVNNRIVDKFAAVNAGKVAELRAALDAQRRQLNESRRRLGDQVDSLGQRLGELQAHVSRLNALGQRLTDMAGLDRGEFSFDSLPAVGGPERPGPWQEVHQPEFNESLQLLEIALAEKEDELRVLEGLLANRELHEKQYPQGWPASTGWLSSAYGSRTDPFTGRNAFHEGVDIAARAGSEVRAMAAGVVSFAGRKPGYGRVIEINHGNGYATRYAHAKALTAEVGDRVAKGDPIARVGSTGRSTGSHVHFEVLKNGEPVNPHDHLQSSG